MDLGKCPKKCFKDCNPCMERVTKMLPCTHEQMVLCHQDPANEFCHPPVWKILPDCRHGMDLLCGASVSDAVCPEMCGMTLDCGHICPLPCHKRSSHDTIQCQHSCQRLCSDQHGFEKKCFEECGNCLTKMTKLLPCGHEGEVECSQNLAEVNCAVKVTKFSQIVNIRLRLNAGNKRVATNVRSSAKSSCVPMATFEKILL